MPNFEPVLFVRFYVSRRGSEPGLWEVRSHVGDGIARVLFTMRGETMILLHGFVKKSAKIPAADLRTARQRLADLRRSETG